MVKVLMSRIGTLVVQLITATVISNIHYQIHQHPMLNFMKEKQKITDMAMKFLRSLTYTYTHTPHKWGRETPGQDSNVFQQNA